MTMLEQLLLFYLNTKKDDLDSIIGMYSIYRFKKRMRYTRLKKQSVD